ncbi:MAG TPA: type VI secretion system baseplate subunit TssG [Gemmatimonadaceae bacterium]|nr:type VI secretion system baseplate subunit TssG [Gemmatimonadaceae bacterium]
MAAERGRTDRSVIERLESEPYRFDFYQAVSLLERMRPEAPSVAEGVDAAREAVRFSSAAGLGFPASEIANVEPPERTASPWRMRVAFLGLGGVQGPLPVAFTERLLSRKSRGIALREFLDIFQHRLVSLMYRVRRRHRIGLDGRPPEGSAVAPMLASIAGLGTPRLQRRLAVDDRALLRYATLLAQRPRSAIGLERMLSSYFGVPVRVRQFVGRWRDIEESDLTRIGFTGQCQILGESAVLGRRVWDQQSTVVLVVGPLAYDRYRDFLPSDAGTALKPLKQLARLYLGPEIDVHVELVLRARETPGMMFDDGDRPMLGWTTFLATSRPRTQNPNVGITREAK